MVGLCEEGAFGRFAKSGYIAVAGGEKNRYVQTLVVQEAIPHDRHRYIILF